MWTACKYIPYLEGDVPEGRPAVVLVHALIVSSRYMVHILKQLARYYWIYAPDLPGISKSEKPSRPLDLAGLSSALPAWMDAVGLKGTVLIGNSMACQIIANLADVVEVGDQRRGRCIV